MSLPSVPPRRDRGFTLIELMITVAIVAILASVAYPSYQDYIRRGQLPEAFSYLSDYRVKLEQYYQDHRNYGEAAGTDCANAAGAPSWANFNPPGTDERFTYSCQLTSATNNQGYTLTARGTVGLTVGNDYTLTHDNLKKTIKYKNTVVDKQCWLAKGSEC